MYTLLFPGSKKDNSTFIILEFYYILYFIWLQGKTYWMENVSKVVHTKHANYKDNYKYILF